MARRRRNVQADSKERPCVPLWLPEDRGSAVGVKVKPDGILSLDIDNLPTLAFVVKETKPEVAQGFDEDDVYAT